MKSKFFDYLNSPEYRLKRHSSRKLHLYEIGETYSCSIYQRGDKFIVSAESKERSPFATLSAECDSLRDAKLFLDVVRKYTWFDLPF